MAHAEVEERELLRAMSWFDGFVVALANPAFLITGLGFSVVSLGGWGAVVVWLISVCLGALHNVIYTELSAMFPDKAGGIAFYAHEAWKRYFSFIGPMAAFGYWIGWSVVLAVNGVIVGGLVQAEFFAGTAAEGSSWNHLSGLGPIDFTFNFQIFVAIVIIAVIWVFNVIGVRPAVWVSYVTGALLLIPLAVLMFLPYVTGDWDSANLVSKLDFGSFDTGIRLVIAWLYIMCWSAYGFECCATFAAEYKDPERDAAKALRAAALFGIVVYGLLPIGAVGTVGQDAVEAAPYSFYVDGFSQILGGGSSIAVILLCAGIILSMNTATLDGSRALYGISRADMTLKWFGRLNKRQVPGNAMTLDALLNVAILVLFAGPSAVIQILTFSNFGYVFAHVVAISGFLLLRRDRPDWPRPIRVSSVWVPIAWFLLACDLVFLILGSLSFRLTGYGNYKELIIGIAILAISLVLYVIRVVVEDKRKLEWRLLDVDVPPARPAPTTTSVK
jgi:amino acid transporter